MSRAELNRAVGLPHATALVVGTIIGTSTFIGTASSVWVLFSPVRCGAGCAKVLPTT